MRRYTVFVYVFFNGFYSGTVNIIKSKRGIKYIYFDITGIFVNSRRRENLLG